MKRYLPIAFSLTLLFCSSQPLFAGPEGQLYWLVGDDQDNFFLHNTSDLYPGAEHAIDQVCLQAPGTGTYSGEIRVPSSLNFPAEKAQAIARTPDRLFQAPLTATSTTPSSIATEKKER